ICKHDLLVAKSEHSTSTIHLTSDRHVLYARWIRRQYSGIEHARINSHSPADERAYVVEFKRHRLETACLWDELDRSCDDGIASAGPRKAVFQVRRATLIVHGNGLAVVRREVRVGRSLVAKTGKLDQLARRLGL